MRKLVALVGLITGAVAAVALLLSGPLRAVPYSVPDPAFVYSWEAIDYHGRVRDSGSLFGLGAKPPDTDGSAAVLADASAAVLVLRNEAGVPQALATRLSVRDDDNDLLRGELGVDTYTNLFWPNRGSVLAVGYENRWPFLQAEVQALRDPEDSRNEAHVVSSLRSDASSFGIVGGSGDLNAAGGHYSETLLATPSQPGGYEGRIAIALD